MVTRKSRSRLARLRYLAGYSSAAKAAACVPMSAHYLAEIESGKRLLSEALVPKLAVVYSCEPYRLRRASRLDVRERMRWRMRSLEDSA